MLFLQPVDDEQDHDLAEICCTFIQCPLNGELIENTNALPPFHSHVGMTNLVSKSPKKRIYFYCTTKFIIKDLASVFRRSYGWVPASAISEWLQEWSISLAWPPLFTGRMVRDIGELVGECTERFFFCYLFSAYTC